MPEPWYMNFGNVAFAVEVGGPDCSGFVQLFKHFVVGVVDVIWASA